MTNSDPAVRERRERGGGERGEKGEREGGEREAKTESSPLEEAQAGPVATDDVSPLELVFASLVVGWSGIPAAFYGILAVGRTRLWLQGDQGRNKASVARLIPCQAQVSRPAAATASHAIH